MLEDYPEFEHKTLKITGLDFKILPAVLEQAWEQAAEVLDIICPRV